jgi:uncharacterized protein
MTPFATFVMAPGAGAGQHSPFMTRYSAGLAERGVQVVTFDFPYMERGRKIPDPQPVLESSFRDVLEQLVPPPDAAPLPLFIGGKSMGGRMASHVAASLDAASLPRPAWQDRLCGLVLLGYPLHPPARPQQVRVDHLPRITHPMLFVQGERDAFGTPNELRLFIDVLPAPCTLHAVEHGDHSFEVLKRSGIAQDSVHTAVLDTITAWMRRATR